MHNKCWPQSLKKPLERLSRRWEENIKGKKVKLSLCFQLITTP